MMTPMVEMTRTTTASKKPRSYRVGEPEREERGVGSEDIGKVEQDAGHEDAGVVRGRLNAAQSLKQRTENPGQPVSHRSGDPSDRQTQ